MKGISYEYVWERQSSGGGSYRPTDPKRITTKSANPPKYKRKDGTLTGYYNVMVVRRLIIGGIK